MNKQRLNKVSIIGCGKVGMTAAYSILHRGGVHELVLWGRHKDELIGEQLDLEHGISYLSPTKILATESYEDIANSDVVIYTAGVSQKPGDTRLDLTNQNKQILENSLPHILKYAPNAVIIIVANPVDILTYHAYKISGLPKGQIFGSGTALDSARFRFHLSQFLDVNPRSIHAYILGEHGDSSFPVLSHATLGGQPLSTLPNFSETKAMKAYEQARTAAYTIIASKGSTFYGIGSVLSHLVHCVLSDSRNVIPVSIPLHQYHGHSGIALSVPCVLGRNGVEQSLEIKLSWEEKQALDKSVASLKEYV